VIYVYWLAGLSALFVGIERLRPRDARQRVLRDGIGTDLVYLVFNGHFLGVLLAMASAPIVPWVERLLERAGLRETVHLGVLSGRPAWVQFAVALVVIDLVYWTIHNLLHRVPALWEFHKVHHSIEELDWIGSFRFHWAEVVVYKSLSYVPLAMLGARVDVLFWLAVFNTAMGHFNHANLRVSIGPLRYLFNSPGMHVWHHAHPEEAPLCNLGITLSAWDWLFGTAFMPAGVPRRLGFPDIERFPRTVPGQMVHPLPVERLLRGGTP
jgi:sterol desaturase/sphingolipid hydroxylase (fatty acid hydroxylase superfamily)